MTKEYVKYKNDMNKLSFRGFTKNDMNLFMAVCSKVKEREKEEVILEFGCLRSISGYTSTATDSFIKDLRKMSKDLMSVNCEIITDNKIDMFNLFSRFTIDKVNQTLTVKVNSDFTWLLNEFTDKNRGYTVFELHEFICLQSKYAKNLYRILKQWRTAGEYIFHSLEDFRMKLDVPDSYANRRLMEKVIRPAVKEIQELDKSFANFKCEPLYLHKRGKPLGGYKFTWQPESRRLETKQTQREKKQNYNDKRSVSNGFANFQQRTYDYDELEKKLLKQSEPRFDDSDIERILQEYEIQ